MATVPLSAVVGLGANLGDRVGQIRAALRSLGKVARVVRVSRIYETEPVGPPQPRYLNAAALVNYRGTADELLDTLLGIERMLGRVREEKWGPRTIDLDILWIDGLAMESERLTVPHPHLTERGFALRPLADVAPHAVDPETGVNYGLLPAAADPGVVPTQLSAWDAS